MAEGSVNRTLRVLSVLCEYGTQSLAELAERTRLSPPTALRFLRIMQDEGFAYQGADRLWRPTLMTWRLGSAIVDRDGWRVAVQEVLAQTAMELDETVVYAAYEDGSTVYVAMGEPSRDVRINVTLGRRYPADQTMTGRCMLAFQPVEHIEAIMVRHWGDRWAGAERQTFLDELALIREQRMATGSGEMWDGLWGAAVPIVDRDGWATGSIGTTLAAGRAPEDPSIVIRPLQFAADQLSGI